MRDLADLDARRACDHLARDRREHAIKLLDALSEPWTVVDVPWTRAGCSCRTASVAARIVAPVARAAVDEDDRLARHVWRVVAATVGLLAPLQLAQLGRGCAVDVRFADREGLERLGVEDD